jgi:hypothetical protein
MGKLAERLADVRRSGVYRVEVTDALEEAAALNGYALARVALDGALDDALRGLCGHALSLRANVLLFTGFETLLRSAPGALEPLLSVLDGAAAERRAAGLPFFAAFLDPARMLSLGPLYNWQRRSSNALLNEEEDEHETDENRSGSFSPQAAGG